VTAMNKATPPAVWAYLVIATLAEAFLATSLTGLAANTLVVVILVLAATEVGAIGAVFMHLKYEPRAVVGIAAASIFFAVLAVALFLASISH